MSLFTLILLLIVVGLAGYFFVRFLYRKDTEIENRRRGAARLAGTLRSIGLKKTPEFLEDYSVGDYSGMGRKVKQLGELFLAGEAAVLEEFEQVFEGLLNARLKTEVGRTYIAAKLADVTGIPIRLFEEGEEE
jgi:hypothetical protein